jgi:hypothetical protein
MNLTYSSNDFDFFLSNIFFPEMITNDGGMKINDMFSFYFLLKTLNPTTVIESGCWNGLSTKLIRKTLGDECNILCIDPITSKDFKDTNTKTIYLTGENFVDFNNLDVNNIQKNNTLCFFDDHQNSAQRVLQCIQKGFTHIFLNDNYPVNAGSHFSIQHLIDNDLREKFDLHNQYWYSINTLPQIDLTKKQEILNHIDTYIVFPNIFPSKIKLWEGIFDSIGFFNLEDKYNIEKYKIFYESRDNYSWNTYIKLK